MPLNILGGAIASFNGVDYYFSSQTKTWQDAENDCVARGGHLTSVHSQAENDFLNQQIIARFVWISPQDKKIELL